MIFVLEKDERLFSWTSALEAECIATKGGSGACAQADVVRLRADAAAYLSSLTLYITLKPRKNWN